MRTLMFVIAGTCLALAAGNAAARPVLVLVVAASLLTVVVMRHGGRRWVCWQPEPPGQDGDRGERGRMMPPWREYPLPESAELDLAFDAFRQALTDLGMPDHPGGLAEAVTSRAYQLLGLLPEAVTTDS